MSRNVQNSRNGFWFQDKFNKSYFSNDASTYISSSNCVFDEQYFLLQSIYFSQYFFFQVSKLYFAKTMR